MHGNVSFILEVCKDALVLFYAMIFRNYPVMSFAGVSTFRCFTPIRFSRCAHMLFISQVAYFIS